MLSFWASVSNLPRARDPVALFFLRSGAWMARLQYRLTFIDVELEKTSKKPPRSQSSPPTSQRDAFDAQFEKNTQERFMKSEMSKLEKRCQLLQSAFSGGHVDHVDPVPMNVKRIDSEVAPTLGSYGHPELCHRPCVNFMKGVCKSGNECNFCHLPHTKNPKFDKQQREMLASLPKPTLLATILPHLRQRVVDHDLYEVQEIVEMLERELILQPGKSNSDGKDGDVSRVPRVPLRMSKMMEGMPMVGLLGLISKNVSGALPKHIREGLDQLRTVTMPDPGMPSA